MRRGAATCALAGSVALLSPSARAAAQEVAVSGSAFVGYAFGAPRGFHWGLELRTRIFAARNQSVCGTSEGAHPAGAVTARLGTIGRHFYGQLLGGISSQFDMVRTAAQLGVGYQFGAEKPLRVPVLLDARVRVALMYFELDARTGRNGAVGAGLTVPSVESGSSCVVGRPVRDDRGAQLSMIDAAAARSANTGPEAAEADYWRRCAIMESESVPAFAVLAIDLVRAGAPAALVEGAIAAGDDEVMHAQLASTCAGEAPSVTPLDAAEVVRGRSHLQGEALLIRLAVESWLDGCLGEGVAAQRAALESERLACPTRRAVSRIIAGDEHRHAQLAWEVLGWALQEGGAPVRRAVRAALDLPWEASEHVDPGRATALGYLDRDAVGGVHHDVRTRALHRLRALI